MGLKTSTGVKPDLTNISNTNAVSANITPATNATVNFGSSTLGFVVGRFVRMTPSGAVVVITGDITSGSNQMLNVAPTTGFTANGVYQIIGTGINTSSQFVVTSVTNLVGTTITMAFNATATIVGGTFYLVPQLTVRTEDQAGANASSAVTIRSGTTANNTSGSMRYGSGPTSGTGASGTTSIFTGNATGSGNSGALNVTTGIANSTGSSGPLLINSGDAFGSGNSGSVTIQSGNGTTRGAVNLDGSTINVSNKNITNVANPVNPTDAVNLSTLSSYAPLASPALTGIPTAPTAISGTNTTQIATTEFVTTAVGSGSGANTSLSNLSSVAFNDSLIPDLDLSRAIGSASKRISTAFIQTLRTDGNITDVASNNAISPLNATLSDSVGQRYNWSTGTFFKQPSNIQFFRLNFAANTIDLFSNTIVNAGLINASNGSVLSSVNRTLYDIPSEVSIDFSGSTDIKIMPSNGAGTGVARTLKFEGKNSSNYIGLKAFDALSSNTTFTLPIADGFNGQAITTDGSGNLGFTTVPTITVSTKAANYTLTSADSNILATASGGAFTLTLPTAVGITGKTFTMSRTDQTFANLVTIDTTSSQTIGFYGTSVTLATQSESWTVYSDGANWQVSSHTYPKVWTAYPSAPTIVGMGTISDEGTYWMRCGDNTLSVKSTFVCGIPTGVAFSFSTMSGGVIFDSTKMASTTNTNSHGVMYNLSQAGSYPSTTVGPYPIFTDTGTNTGVVYAADGTSASRFNKMNGTAHFATSDRARVEFSAIPVVGWT